MVPLLRAVLAALAVGTCLGGASACWATERARGGLTAMNKPGTIPRTGANTDTVSDQTVHIVRTEITCGAAAAPRRSSGSLLAPQDAHASALEHQASRQATRDFKSTIDPSTIGHAAPSWLTRMAWQSES